jgi:hypothetical protein
VRAVWASAGGVAEWARLVIRRGPRQSSARGSLYLVDLEGDGQDEVVYDSSYYEGSYSLVMTWDAAGKAVQRTLSGDGA